MNYRSVNMRCRRESIWTWEETIVEEIKYNKEPIIWEKHTMM